jgi:hypothetical protein
MKLFACSGLLTLLISAAAYSQAKSDVCRVNTSWWSRSEIREADSCGARHPYLHSLLYRWEQEEKKISIRMRPDKRLQRTRLSAAVIGKVK